MGNDERERTIDLFDSLNYHCANGLLPEAMEICHHGDESINWLTIRIVLTRSTQDTPTPNTM